MKKSDEMAKKINPARIEERNQICLLRLDNESMSSIAKKLGTTKQTVSLYLKNLPTGDADTQIIITARPAIDKNTVTKIVHLYNAGASIDDIVELTGVTRQEIFNLFAYFKSTRRKTNSITSQIAAQNYPDIVKWMKDNEVSIPRLAKTLGLHSETLTRMLIGESYLNMNTAIKIKKLTSLTYKQIFAKHYEDWMEEFEN